MVKTNLNYLGDKYQTDKARNYHGQTRHGYLDYYELYLEKWRESDIRLLEIGICMEGTKGGHSIRMWHEYFLKAKIFGFDIVDMKYLENELDRVKIFQGDASSRNEIENMYQHFGNEEFDFILEDGSHTYEHQMISLAACFKYVKSGGLYILEDMAATDSEPYSPVNRGNHNTLLFLKDFIENKKIKRTYPYMIEDEMEYLEKNIDKIELHLDIQNLYYTAVITKK